MVKGVRFIPEEKIEQKAIAVLEKAEKQKIYQFKSHTPVDLIAEKIFKLHIRFTNLNQDLEGVLGALDINNKIIWIDDSLNGDNKNFTLDARCNFTIAHELGHYAFHKKLYNEENIQLYHYGDNQNKAIKNMETQADLFASHILMPTTVLMKKLNSISQYQPFNQTLFELTRFFKVSKEAMIIRLKKLGLVDDDYEL
jgi:Zn-dependent peptidase ImmA (M78 family)